MKLTPTGKNTIETVRLLAGSTYEQSKEFFEFFITYILLNFLQGKETVIPYFGTMKINYEGDEVTAKGREAKITFEFTADQNLKKIIGQAIDGEETEIEKVISEKFRQDLEAEATPEKLKKSQIDIVA